MDYFNLGVFSSELKYDLSASNKLRILSDDFVQKSQWILNSRELKIAECQQYNNIFFLKKPS